jgi:hypothetical protein
MKDIVHPSMQERGRAIPPHPSVPIVERPGRPMPPGNAERRVSKCYDINSLNFLMLHFCYLAWRSSGAPRRHFAGGRLSSSATPAEGQSIDDHASIHLLHRWLLCLHHRQNLAQENQEVAA